MKYTSLLLLFFGISLFGCVSDEDPDQAVILDGELTINIPANFSSTYNEVWVILHNTDGEPIETRKVEGQASLVFQLDDAQRYHLTTYRKAESFGNQIELLESFTDISVAEDFTLGLTRPFPQEQPVSGQFKVNISHSSLPFGAAISSPSQQYNFLGSQNGSQLELTSAYETPSKEYLLMAKNGEGEMRYTILNVPNPGVTLTSTFSDLKKYDQVLKFNKVDYSELYFNCVALSEVNNSLVSNFIISSNRLPLLGFDPSVSHEIGFLNSFKNYELTISGRRRMNSKTTFAYHRIGTAPGSIQFPEDREIQVQNSDISNFQFSLPSENTYWVGLWDQSEPIIGSNVTSLRWIVIGSKSTIKISLPSNLTQGKPKLQDLSKFSLESMEVTKHSQSYDSQVRNRLVEWPKKQPMESTSVTQFY